VTAAASLHVLKKNSHATLKPLLWQLQPQRNRFSCPSTAVVQTSAVFLCLQAKHVPWRFNNVFATSRTTAS
jgi:hypothetical protein